MTTQKVPSKWHVPDGYVLTWYPPFAFPFHVDPDHAILVYNEAEPFVQATAPDGSLAYNPNVTSALLSDFDGVHPGVYALSKFGDHKLPEDLHPTALQIYGKKVSS